MSHVMIQVVGSVFFAIEFDHESMREPILVTWSAPMQIDDSLPSEHNVCVSELERLPT